MTGICRGIAMGEFFFWGFREWADYISGFYSGRVARNRARSPIWPPLVHIAQIIVSFRVWRFGLKNWP